MATLREGQFTVHRGARHAEHHFTGSHQGDLRGKHRVAAYESLCAIDGVDEPQALGILSPRAGLLPEKAMTRKSRLEDFSNRDLAADVGLRDRRGVRLDPDFEAALIQRSR